MREARGAHRTEAARRRTELKAAAEVGNDSAVVLLLLAELVERAERADDSGVDPKQARVTHQRPVISALLRDEEPVDERLPPQVQATRTANGDNDTLPVALLRGEVLPKDNHMVLALLLPSAESSFVPAAHVRPLEKRMPQHVPRNERQHMPALGVQLFL